MKTKVVLLMLLLCLGIGVIATQVPALPLLPKQSALAAPASELTTTAASGFKKAMQQLGALFLNTNGTLNVGENMGDSETEDCDIILSEEVKEDLERAVKYTSLQKGKKYLTPTSEDGLIDDTCVPVEGAKIEKGECTLCYHEPQFQAKRGSVNPFDVGFELQIWKDIYGCNSNTLLSSNLVETRFCAYSRMEDYCDTLREEPTFYEVAFYFNRKTDCLGDYSQEVEIRQIPKLEEGTQLTIAEENYKITKSDKIPFGTNEGKCTVARYRIDAKCTAEVKLTDQDGNLIGTKSLDETFEGLSIGTYHILITPNNGNVDCDQSLFTADFTIEGYCKPMTPSVVNLKNADMGINNGTVEIAANENAALPVTFELIGADATTSSSNENGQFGDLSAGNYTIKCTDKNNCSGEITVKISTNCTDFELAATTSPTNSQETFYTGSIQAIAVAPNCEFDYQLKDGNNAWRSNVDNSGYFTQLSAGQYSVRATVKNTNCYKDINVEIIDECPTCSPAVLCKDLKADVTSTAPSINSLGKITVTVSGVHELCLPKLYTLTQKNRFLDQNETGEFENLDPGNYAIFVYDKNDGCGTEVKIDLKFQCPNSFSLSGNVVYDNNYNVNGLANIIVQSKPVGYYTYQNWGDAPLSNFSSLPKIGNSEISFGTRITGLYTIFSTPGMVDGIAAGVTLDNSDKKYCRVKSQRFVVNPYLEAQDNTQTRIYNKGTYTVCASKNAIQFKLYVDQNDGKVLVDITNLYWQLDGVTIEKIEGDASGLRSIDVSKLDATQNHTLKIIQQFDDGSENEVYSCTITVKELCGCSGNPNDNSFLAINSCTEPGKASVVHCYVKQANGDIKEVFDATDQCTNDRWVITASTQVGTLLETNFANGGDIIETTDKNEFMCSNTFYTSTDKLAGFTDEQINNIQLYRYTADANGHKKLASFKTKNGDNFIPEKQVNVLFKAGEEVKITSTTVTDNYISASKVESEVNNIKATNSAFTTTIGAYANANPNSPKETDKLALNLPKDDQSAESYYYKVNILSSNSKCCGGFGGFTDAEVTQSINERIANPELIDQGTTSLCGMAVIGYLFAKYDPSSYLAFVDNMYNYGCATNVSTQFKVKTSNRHLQQILQNDNRYPWASPSKNPSIPRKRMSAADYLFLTTLRDFMNQGLDYTPAGKPLAGSIEAIIEGARGLTTPLEISYLLENFLGYKSVEKNLDLTFSKQEQDVNSIASTLNNLQNTLNLGNKIVMLIHDDMIYNLTTPKTSIPTHWVLYLGGLNFDIVNQKVTFNIFTWGQIKTLTISFKAFKTNYYGYIQGK